MTIIISINKESVVYENIREFSCDGFAYSLTPENGEGFCIPVENTEGFTVTGGATEAKKA